MAKVSRSNHRRVSECLILGAVLFRLDGHQCKRTPTEPIAEHARRPFLDARSVTLRGTLILTSLKGLALINFSPTPHANTVLSAVLHTVATVPAVRFPSIRLFIHSFAASTVMVEASEKRVSAVLNTVVQRATVLGEG